MTAEDAPIVPVWTLATEQVDLPDVTCGANMTPERLAELRTVLATLADTPIATLEAHPLSTKRNRAGGIPLDAASPLAQNLSLLMSQSAKSSSAVANVAASGEVLYRMVVPAKVAAQVGKGLMQPMLSKAAAGGVHGALVNWGRIAAQATFVPVAGSATSAGAAAVGAGALTIAAPLMLMAVAAGASAYADHRREQALERITGLLEKLHEDKLDEERSQLDGCRDAITKATAILLDQGRVGASLGLDATVYAINVAVERAIRRLGKWQQGLSEMPARAELATVLKSFPGVTEETGGEFRAHLELAKLAIALKRRVLVLQAVEHAQLEGANHPFKRFIETLKEDEKRVNELESGITTVLRHLSTLELKRYGGIRSVMFTQGEVDDLLRASYRLRALGDEVNDSGYQPDVAIEIEKNANGSVLVFPAEPITA
ncbi:hypothetical protein [Mycobacterium sp. 3519A]|uniref:hypothetical protein n=1 Tax=Mycobacterium sp. 3519A TaxID=2057184 RepID=UPI000C7ADED6|nr:hypothetical protein [Mycobacterium sp. 3519A]